MSAEDLAHEVKRIKAWLAERFDYTDEAGERAIKEHERRIEEERRLKERELNWEKRKRKSFEQRLKLLKKNADITVYLDGNEIGKGLNVKVKNAKGKVIGKVKDIMIEELKHYLGTSPFPFTNKEERRAFLNKFKGTRRVLCKQLYLLDDDILRELCIGIEWRD